VVCCFAENLLPLFLPLVEKPSLCNVTPSRKCSCYNVDLKLDDVSRCKHRCYRATDLIKAAWIPETTNPSIFNNTYVNDIHALKSVEKYG
jgi:hypothetical protein